MISTLVSPPAAGSAPAGDLLMRVADASMDVAAPVVPGALPGVSPDVSPVPLLPAALPPAFAQCLDTEVGMALPEVDVAVPQGNVLAALPAVLPVTLPMPAGGASPQPADDQPALPALGPDPALLAQLMPTLPMPVALAPVQAEPVEADAALPAPVVQSLDATHFALAAQAMPSAPVQTVMPQAQAPAPAAPEFAKVAVPAATTALPAALTESQDGDATVADAQMPAQLPRWNASVLAATSQPSPMPDAPLTLGNDAGSAWQQPLLQALGDKLQVQIAARSEQARLQLEPPQLGRIEIEIRQQGGTLQVQLSATHDEVRQQLRQISEPLRHDLVQRHSGEVSVQVATSATASPDSRGRDGAGGQPHGQAQRDGQQRQPGRAWDTENDGTAAFHEAYAGHGQL